jgi:adenosyl cobinamide kinase/adenosyl cobinamide phosphate guanylyltransferase
MKKEKKKKIEQQSGNKKKVLLKCTTYMLKSILQNTKKAFTKYKTLYEQNNCE